MKICSGILLLILVSQVNCQIVLNFDTYNTDDNLIEEIYGSQSLDSGITYCMEIVGTYSVWNPSYWTSPCGLIENAPIYPSPVGNMTGNVGFDFKYKFSFPNQSLCSGQMFPELATPQPRIEITLDGGLTWFHPFTSAPFNTDHRYQYKIVGQGFPLGVRQNSALNSDDYGILKFTINDVNCIQAELTMPNVFTPNDDGINDAFLPIEYSGVIEGKMRIYNRWGELLFSGNMNDGWDGYFNEKACVEGTYFWTISYTDLYDNIHEKHGFLTLIR